MKTILSLPLDAKPDQLARLQRLQQVFSMACNALSPMVQQHKCWNRVALHHLMYRNLRERFPELGSQMVCNAIYSVSRMARLVYQHPQSPFNVGRGNGGSTNLPLLVFAPTAPVYFDRHTLSVKQGRLSMYSLDGRMHFNLALAGNQSEYFGTRRLREVVLQGSGDTGYRLSFEFESEVSLNDAAETSVEVASTVSPPDWPSYLQLELSK